MAPIIQAVKDNDTTSYTSNIVNQYTQINTAVPTYDQDGNMLTNGEWSYTWNGENRMISAQTTNRKVEFAYDYMGRCFERKEYTAANGSWNLDKTVYIVYDDYKQIAEYVNGDLYQQYVWDVAGLDTVAFMGKNNSTYMYWTDGNKNVLKLFDATGVLASYSYDPFGKVATSEGLLVTDNPFRFSSEYHNDITGLVEYIYRKYDPVIGRWINRDPIEEEGGLNLYVSVYNCLIDMIDKNGLSVFFVPRGIRHKLTIDLVEEDDQPMILNRPLGYVALPQKGVNEIIAHLNGMFKDNINPYHHTCHCIEYIDITNHSGVAGFINFNDNQISSRALPTMRSTADRKIFLLLSTINRYLCSDNSEVRFSQCNAGQGAEGKKLESFLQSYFRENVKITLYETKVTFFAGFTLRI